MDSIRCKTMKMLGESKATMLILEVYELWQCFYTQEL